MRKHLNTSSSFTRKKEIVKSIKPNLVKQHSDRIELKLASLKTVIKEKKETSRLYKEKEKNIDSNISKFLAKIGMNTYLPKLIDNGVQTFELFQEIKQKELQQIGIPKGHALKIVINLKRQQDEPEKSVMLSKKTNQHDTKKTDATLTKQSQDIYGQKVGKKVGVETLIQTQSTFVEEHNRKKYFCLFCYMKAQKDFCSERCQQSYDRMFRKYQDNLVKAQKMFGSSQIQKSSQSQQQDYDDGTGFMDFMYQQFPEKTEDSSLDQQNYDSVKQKIKSLIREQQ